MSAADRRLRLPGLALLAALLASCWASAADAQLPRALVAVAGHVIQVEVADTPAARMRGLSGRARLDAGHGMLFPYAVPDRPGFWMKDMRFALDLIWIRDGRVVDLTLRAPYRAEGRLPIYMPREPVDLVLEVPAGTAEHWHWRRGDPVRVDPPWPRPSGGAP